MLNKPSIKLFTTFALILLASQVSLASTAQDRGLEISKEMKTRDAGWGDNTAGMSMLLRNQYGDESIRELHIKTLEQDNEGDKSLTIFSHPKDVKGTAFLSFSHTLSDDDQWLYLPALKRVKRISSSNKSGPFMGSEFSFEDLSSFEIEKYNYEYLSDERVNNIDSYKIIQYPVDKNSGYTRRLVWVDKLEYRLQKVEFYDRKNALLKTLLYSDYQLYLGQYWRANNMQMTNHQSGKTTELKWRDYAFKVGLKESDFKKNALKRAR